MENENNNSKKYNSEKAHQYYLTHLNKNNEKIRCSDCGVMYQYYSKARHLKSKTHQTALKYHEEIKKIQNKQHIEVFKFENELTEDQINQMMEMSKDPRIINAFINLVIDAFNKPPPVE